MEWLGKSMHGGRATSRSPVALCAAICGALVLAALGLVWSGGALGDSPTGGRVVRGRVEVVGLDAGQPSGMAQISVRASGRGPVDSRTIWESAVATGDDGSFRIADVPQSVNQVELELDLSAESKYCKVEVIRTPVSEELVLFRLRLASRVAGRVELLNGAAVEDLQGAQVYAYWTRLGVDDVGFANVPVAPDGTFLLEVVPKGAPVTLALQPAHRARVRYYSNPVLARSGQEDVVLRAVAATEIRGSLVPRTPGSSVCRSALVHLRPWSAAVSPYSLETQTVLASTEGAFRFSNVLPGSYRLFVFSKRAAAGSSPLVAISEEVTAEGEPLTLECGFADPKQVSVVLSGGAGEAFSLAAWGDGQFISQSHEGRIPASGVWRGELEIPSASLECMVVAQTATGLIACGACKTSTTSLALELARARTVRGILKRSDFDRVIIMADVGGWHFPTSFVGPQGQFEIEGLPDVSMDLVVYGLRPHPSTELGLRPGEYTFRKRFSGVRAGGATSLSLD